MLISSSRLSKHRSSGRRATVGLACAIGLLACLPARAEDLRPYKPESLVHGVIRDFGFSLGGIMPIWEEGFRKVQPGVTFEDKFPSGDAAIAGLTAGVSDIGPQGRELTLIEYLMFFETFKYLPTPILVTSGAYDAEGMTNGLIIYVNKDNPIGKLSMQQLDRIFGAERTGSYTGFKWQLGTARGPETNIRTWGQLGLTGEWADKPIHTYGHAPSGTTNFFQIKVLSNSDKWNPNYRQFVESGSKMISDSDKAAQLGGIKHMLADELGHDKYGIGWTVLPQALGITGIKPLAIAPGDSTDYVAPSRESFSARTYPLTRSVFFYLNRAPGTPLDPKVKEFIRYVLSKDGQDAVAKANKYLPLPAAVANAEAKKLD